MEPAARVYQALNQQMLLLQCRELYFLIMAEMKRPEHLLPNLMEIYFSLVSPFPISLVYLISTMTTSSHANLHM